MTKTLSTRIACAAVLGGVGWGAIAAAQVTGPPAPITPDLGFIGQYEALRSVWFFTLFPLATALFWKLAAIEMVLSGVLWVSSQQSFDAITGHLFRKIFWIGFSYAVLLYADTWIPAVIDSFSMAGLQASGLEQLSPGSIFAQGLQLAVHLLFTMSGIGVLKNIVGAVVGIFAALAIAIAYTFIAIEMAVTLSGRTRRLGLGDSVSAGSAGVSVCGGSRRNGDHHSLGTDRHAQSWVPST